jgi:16S rRNA (guanine966-N2)-methyltransferase
MRVVAGSARGRQLVAPKGDAVRPTGDRVREALFNSLGSMGMVRGSRVLDLFAGSGALGIEALSRGAEHVTFVDSSREALRAVRENLERCGFADRASVAHGDALEWLRSAGGPDGQVDLDLALLDPPYRFDRWDELLASLPARVAAMESDRSIDTHHPWEVLKSRRYGGTVVTVVGRMDRDGHGNPTSEERS